MIGYWEGHAFFLDRFFFCFFVVATTLAIISHQSSKDILQEHRLFKSYKVLGPLRETCSTGEAAKSFSCYICTWPLYVILMPAKYSVFQPQGQFSILPKRPPSHADKRRWCVCGGVFSAQDKWDAKYTDFKVLPLTLSSNPEPDWEMTKVTTWVALIREMCRL